jgi:hypothetical protein
MPNNEITTEPVAPGVVRARVTPAPAERKRQAELGVVRKCLDEIEPGPTRILLVLILKRLGLYEEQP